jgi:hypothetical protein
MHSKSPRFFFLLEGGGGWLRVFSFLFWLMGGFLCHDTLLFWFCLQGRCGGPKIILFFPLESVGHMESTLGANIFGLVCNMVLKVQIYFFCFSLAWVDHMDRTLEINFFWSLVCKEVLFFSLFLFTWVHHTYRKLKIFFGFVNLSMFSWIHWFSIHVNFFLCSFIISSSLCYREKCMLSANRTCLLYGNVLKIKIFTWISANKWAMWTISMLGVCQCVKSGFF